MQTFSFKPVDTWFFKQALPHNSLAAQELKSLFPPSPRTLIGALRTAIGEQAGVNWPAFRQGNMPQIERLIGDKSQPLPPRAEFSGPWIVKGGKRYYPAPLHWLGKRTEQGYQLNRLMPTVQAIQCDIGCVRLPASAIPESGAKPLEDCYVDVDTLTKMSTSLDFHLAVPSRAILTASDLFCEEPRLGIARNDTTHKAENGMLYQTRHLRLKEDVWLELDCCDDWQVTQFEQGMITLGGEARPCHISHCAKSDTAVIPAPSGSASKRIAVTLLTPAHFTKSSAPWLPESFRPDNESNPNHWSGELKGIGLKLISAVLGKTHREGGWDIAEHRARAVESFVPAGSTYFFEAADGETAIRALHGQSIGNYTQFGRGYIVAGYW